MKKLIILSTILLILFPVILYAGMPREPQALSQGGGGRAFNLGFSGVAEAFDTSSLYINPAGLAQMEDYEFSLFYGMYQTAWYNDIYGAFGIPIGKRQAIAFSVRYFGGSSKKENEPADLMQYDDNLRNYGNTDTQFIGNFGYGIGITDKIRFGASMKFFYQNLKQVERGTFPPYTEIPYSRFEMGLDAGMQFDLAHFFSAGIHVRNAFSIALKNSPSTNKNFPVFIRPGIAFKLLNDRLIINADIGIPTISSRLAYHFGFSFRITKWLTLYGGASNDFYVGGLDIRPFEELIFFIGAGYHKTSAADGVNFDNDDNSRGGFTIGFGLTFIIRPPSRKINREVRDFIRAQQAMMQGNYGRAMDILQDIQRSDPNNRDLNELTQEYLRVAQRRATTTDWMSAADRARIAKYMQEGQSEYGRRNYAKSIQAFRRVIDIHPAHPEANQWIARVRREVNREATRWYQIGEKHYIAGKIADAEKALRTCLSIDPEYLPATELLARIVGGDSVAALREGIQVPRINTAGVPGATVIAGGGTQTVPQFSEDPSQRVMQEARTEVEKLFQLGETFYYQANYVDCIAILNKFIARSDNEELKLKAKAIIVNAENKYKEQENAQARRQRSERLYQLGMAAYREQRYRDAIDAFDKAVVADSTNMKAINMSREANRQLTALLRKYINEGVALREQKEYDAAIAKFDMVVQTDAEHELAVEAKRLKVATLEERKGAAERHLAIARDALRNRQYQAALTNFNIVLRIEPRNPEALKGREEALKLFQGTIDKLLAQGRDELNKKNFPQAIVFFDRVLLIDRNNRAAEEGKKQAQDLMEQATTRRTVKENLEVAKLRFENRDYDLALDTLNRVLRAEPNNVQAAELKKKCLAEIEKEKDRRKIMTLFSEGAREFRRRNYDGAVTKWTQVLNLQTQSTDFDSRVIQEYIERAKVLKREAGNIALQEGDKFFAAKQYKKAKERYTEALQRSPNSNEIRLKLTRVDQIISQEIRNSFKQGETHFNEGRYDEAIKAYKRILDYEQEGSELANTAKDELQRSEDALKARQKGDEFFSQKNYAEAIAQFEYIIAINRKDAYAMERRREAMVELSRQAQKIKRDAITLLEQKNYARAITLLGIVVRADPDDREAKAKLEQAKQEAQIALEQNYNMGIRAFNAQNWKVSVDAFNVVRAIDPNYKETNKFYRRALDNYNRIQAQSSAQRQGELQGLFYQGITLYRQNKLREAIAVWNRILAVDPGNERARQYIQRARFRLGG